MTETKEKKKSWNGLKGKVLNRTFIVTFIAVILGGTLGYLYYHFVGCSSGTCAITSNPFSSIMMGGVLGYLLAGTPCINNKC
jgi:hypothetical protein